jgi:hypothetical protein
MLFQLLLPPKLAKQPLLKKLIKLLRKTKNKFIRKIKKTKIKDKSNLRRRRLRKKIKKKLLLSILHPKNLNPNKNRIKKIKVLFQFPKL